MADSGWLEFLPHFQAVMVSLALGAIFIGFLRIRDQDRVGHRKAMLSAIVFSALFLAAYLLFHLFIGMRPYPGAGWLRSLFFGILISHVFMAVTLLPMIFLTLRHAFRSDWDAHRPLARKTFAVWTYVGVTGLIVYFMGHHLPYGG
ncbi:MAG: DUF420 domain-containing protein [Magnetococcales bacterium]|nr:DUF420 domain-containing protein [Magnetococcales bacterium]